MAAPRTGHLAAPRPGAAIEGPEAAVEGPEAAVAAFVGATVASVRPIAQALPMPPRRRSVRQADREAGQAAEAAFAGWLDLSRVPYLYAEQSRETFSAGLRGSAKRPDFLIGCPISAPWRSTSKSRRPTSSASSSTLPRSRSSGSSLSSST